jgi:DNA-binding NarL/FixJ family response regulator
MGIRARIADNPGMKRTVLIVDDHAGFRASARRVLEAGGYSVIAEAADGSSGVTAAAEARPDLALVDVQLPDFDGFEVTRRLQE